MFTLSEALMYYCSSVCMQTLSRLHSVARSNIVRLHITAQASYIYYIYIVYRVK